MEMMEDRSPCGIERSRSENLSFHKIRIPKSALHYHNIKLLILPMKVAK